MATPDRDSYYLPMQAGDPGDTTCKRLRTYKLTLLGIPTEELYTRDVKPTLATVTTATRSATVQTALAENLNRMGAIFYNDTAGACYIKFGAGASLTDFTNKLKVDEKWVLEQPVYTGEITCIWNAGGTEKLRITELTESPTL